MPVHETEVCKCGECQWDANPHGYYDWRGNVVRAREVCRDNSDERWCGGCKSLLLIVCHEDDGPRVPAVDEEPRVTWYGFTIIVERMAADYAKLDQQYREACLELNTLQRWHDDVSNAVAEDLRDRRICLEYDISEVETILSDAIDKAKKKLMEAYESFDAGSTVDLTQMCDECRAKMFPVKEAEHADHADRH